AVSALRRTILMTPSAGDAAEDRVVRAVLGLVLFSGITRADLPHALAAAPSSALDVDRGTLTLRLRATSTSGFRETLPADTVTLPEASLSLCLSVRLAAPSTRRETSPGHTPLLPPPWNEPAVLRSAVDRALRNARVPGWSRFLAAVRMDLLLDGGLPLLIARGAGNLVCAVAANADADGLIGPYPRRRHRG